MPIPYATATDTGRVRSANEDSLLARPPLFMVADGMGGASGGEIASSVAAEIFSSFSPGSDEAKKQLLELVREANRRIFELALADTGLMGMGTTVTAAIVDGGKVAIAHVGDSRAYCLRQGGLKQLTEDHSLVGEMLRRGSISEAEAEIHPQRSIITRALGIEPEVEVDVFDYGWEPGDTFLLCSDGLTSMVNDDQIAGLLAGAEELDEAAAALVGAANAGGGKDNVTVILFSPAEVAAAGPSTIGDTAVFRAPGESGQDREGSTGEADMAGPAAGAQAKPSRQSRKPVRGGGGGLRRWLASTSGRVAIAVLAGVILLAGAWLANRNIYYVEADGVHAAIYRGVPVELGPLAFSSVYSTSDVRIEDMDAIDRERMARHDLMSLVSAETVIDSYRRNIVAREQDRRPQAQGPSTTRTGTTKTNTATTTTAATTPGGGN